MFRVRIDILISMSRFYPRLDDDQKLALGELTWAAIELEGLVGRACEKISGKPNSGRYLDVLIAEARKVMREDIPAHVRAGLGFSAAKAVLDHRHKVLHSTAAAVIRFPSQPEWEIQLKNERKGGVITYTQLSSETFRSISSQIEEVISEMEQVDLDLALL